MVARPAAGEERDRLWQRWVAVDPQPDTYAPNHPNFPSNVLRPGQEYTTTTRWLIS